MIENGVTLTVQNETLSVDEFNVAINDGLDSLVVTATLGGQFFTINLVDSTGNVFMGPGLPGKDLSESDFDSLIGEVTTPPFFSDPVIFAIDTLTSEVLLLGDVNGDGAVDLLDVAPFVDLLVNNEFLVAADLNQDGVVDLLDIAPFVSAISGN